MKKSVINKTALVSLGLACMMTSPLIPGAMSGFAGTVKRAADDHPNIIYINTDDLGYGDVGCYGSKLNRTPNIDNLANEGIRFTDFYGCPLCTPSRMSFMTGCYPLRAGLPSVIGPNANIGISDNEVTVAEQLKGQGYKTAIVGKWHLGHQEEFLPTNHGFDSYFGIPYSNDFFPNLPLMQNTDVLEYNPDQSTLTQRYTEECINFIKRNRNQPFFLYMAHTYVHKPLRVTEESLNKSNNGKYGAEVEMVDWSVGQIVNAVKELGLEENTMIVFTSDNGGYLALKPDEGDTGTVSNAPLKGGKGQANDGGCRVPFIVRWKGQLPEGKVNSEVASVMDMFATFSNLAGAEIPTDRVIDSKDIMPLMKCEEGAVSPHEQIYIYVDKDLRAVRADEWKYNIRNKALYHISEDIGETTNLSSQYPDKVKEFTDMINAGIKDIGGINIIGENARPAGNSGKSTSVYDNKQGGTVEQTPKYDIPVIDMIDALPSADELDRNNADQLKAIEDARIAFENMPEDYQEMVMASNFDHLAELEEILRTPEIIKGDMDGNEIIDVNDLTALKASVMAGDKDDDTLARGDMDNNGIIDVNDMTALKKVIMDQK